VSLPSINRVCSENVISDVVTILGEMLLRNGGKIPLHEPEFSGNEEKLLVDCLRSTYVSSVGRYVDEFEQALALACGVNHSVAVVNGTAALQVALRIAGVNVNSEVLMPSFTFVATANAAHYLGGIPHFVDISEKTLGIDPIALRERLNEIAEVKDGKLINGQTGRTISALLPMHTFGNPCDMEALLSVAKDFDLPLIEDAAEALGSQYHGKPCGSFGAMAAVSFNGNKIITTGGGGAILTNDPELARQAKHLTTTSKLPHQWEFVHDQIGYNYRLPNINAALGVAQLAQLESKVKSKRALAKQYQRTFDGIQNVRIFEEVDGSESNYWLNSLILDQDNAPKRDELLEELSSIGILSRPAWTPLHTLDIFAQCPRGNLSLTESLFSRIVNIPSSAYLAETVSV
jgi:perosamine synthetase